MNDSSLPAPTFAAVLYLRLSDFPLKPVVEQARLRVQLEAAVDAGLRALPEADRIVLDAADGLIVVVLANVAGALEASERFLESAKGLPLCIGANHGPVALAAEHHEAEGMVGDGIRAAAVAAGFAKPGQMLATRSFREALAEQSPRREPELLAAGTFSDSSVRTHELFLADRGAGRRRRRRLLALGSACVVAILAAGGLTRAVRHGAGPFAPPATLAFEIAPAGAIYVNGERRGDFPQLQQLDLRAGSYSVEVRHGDFAPYQIDLQLAAGEQATVRHVFLVPAALVFDVTPGGEVFVDGKPRGTIPEVQRIEVRAGAHTVEVRHGKLPALQLDVRLRAGEEYRVQHAFVRPAVLTFEISPAGELFVDGQSRGMAPPLRRLELAPGLHTIEIRSGKFPPLKFRADLKAGEQRAVNHTFEKPSIMRNLRDLFGGG